MSPETLVRSEAPQTNPHPLSFLPNLAKLRSSLATRLMAAGISLSGISALTACSNDNPKDTIEIVCEDQNGNEIDCPDTSGSPDGSANEQDAGSTFDTNNQNDITSDTGTVDSGGPVDVSITNPDTGTTPDTAVDSGTNQDGSAELPNSSCGDGVCDEDLGECTTCVEDCQDLNDCLPFECGDGTCDPNFESSADCPQDCGPECTPATAAMDCNDQVDCTVDTCENNVCVNTSDDMLCDDQIACTVDICNDQTDCTNQNVNQLCNDNDPCTNDQCNPNNIMADPNGCLNNEKPVDDQDPCTVDSCNPVNGAVMNTPVQCAPDETCNPQTGICEDGPVAVQPSCPNPADIIEIETYTQNPNAKVTAVDNSGQIIAPAAQCTQPQQSPDVVCFQTCQGVNGVTGLAVTITGESNYLAAGVPTGSGDTIGVKTNYQGADNVFPAASLPSDVGANTTQYDDKGPNPKHKTLVWTK